MIIAFGLIFVWLIFFLAKTIYLDIENNRADQAAKKELNVLARDLEIATANKKLPDFAKTANSWQAKDDFLVAGDGKNLALAAKLHSSNSSEMKCGFPTPSLPAGYNFLLCLNF